MNTNRQALKTFLVRVGHWEIQLKAQSTRKRFSLPGWQMARELPRLYDVIRS